MKTDIKEYNDDFYIFIEPENIKEVKVLLSLAKTSSKNNVLIDTFFADEISTQIKIIKNKNKKFKRWICNQDN